MEYLTPEEVAEKMRVTSEAVRNWLRTGKLKGEKAGRYWRIKEDDLDFIANASLQDAVLIKVLKKRGFSPIIEWILNLAEKSIPKPLLEEATEIVKKGDELFSISKDGNYIWEGSIEGSTEDIFDRIYIDDVSWVNELISLYKNEELEKEAEKQGKVKSLHVVMDLLLENKDMKIEEKNAIKKEIIRILKEDENNFSFDNVKQIINKYERRKK